MAKSSLKRLDEFERRLVQTRDDRRKRCWVLDCPRPPGNASPKGLGRFCRKHLEHYRRHGDPLKPSYRAPRLKEYRQVAAAWIGQTAGDPYVQNALQRIAGLKTRAGPAIPPRRLRGVPAKEKARAVWARLRDRNVANETILAAILGVAMCYEHDPQKGKVEYRRVQIAKVLSRMGGGEVKRWATHSADPRLPKERVLRWFPASEGQVLRELGRMAEEAAEFLIHDRMDDLLAMYRQRQEKRTERAMRNLPFPD